MAGYVKALELGVLLLLTFVCWFEIFRKLRPNWKSKLAFFLMLKEIQIQMER